MGMRSFQKNAIFCVFLQKTLCSLRSVMFLAKEHCVLCVILRSLQNNVAFFYVLKKRMHRSFGFHKLPKTRKQNAKECFVLKKNTKKRCLQNVKERGAQP